MQQRKVHTGNTGLFIVIGLIYIGILILFAWQTWSFVDWLFPGDQLLMKLLTVLCFDVMALVWACLDLFYHHATRGARTLIRWAWAISFILSLIASVFYLILESILRFSLPITATMVNIGYGVTIVAVTETVLFITFWLYQEWSVRHPHTDDYAYEQPEQPVRPRLVMQAASLPQTHNAPEAPAPAPAPAPAQGTDDGTNGWNAENMRKVLVGLQSDPRFAKMAKYMLSPDEDEDAKKATASQSNQAR